MARLPEVYVLTHDDVKSLIDVSLTLRDRKMFKNYSELLKTMERHKAPEIAMEAFTGKNPIYSYTDDKVYIIGLMRDDVKGMIDLSLLLNDQKMFDEYNTLLKDMTKKGFTRAWRKIQSDEREKLQTNEVKIYINGTLVGTVESLRVVPEDSSPSPKRKRNPRKGTQE